MMHFIDFINVKVSESERQLPQLRLLSDFELCDFTDHQYMETTVS